ncbi:transcriptional repressor LexA [Allofustis seminis]|uniref:transcriptional repressor LexA n=1 Tax=Allofustis seminis TaxID=166939 RepID=UPI00036F880B|nr:transcriptional repressor LexA [Allofustis seminis]
MKPRGRGKKGETRDEILLYIYETVMDQGYPPTVREIGEAMNLSSTSTVHGHLTSLEALGFIEKDPTKPRAIGLTEAGLEKLGVSQESFEGQIPIVGTVTAGTPILATQNIEDFFPLPDTLAYEEGNLFMLTISGDSMINVGIFDGDQVIVRQQATARNGEIVIAMTEDDEATCKRFYKEEDYIKLMPENDLYDPIILPNVTILGKVISLFRSHIF